MGARVDETRTVGTSVPTATIVIGSRASSGN
jgi:hypothetical protein